MYFASINPNDWIFITKMPSNANPRITSSEMILAFCLTGEMAVLDMEIVGLAGEK